MREIRKSGSMRGEGKRGDAHGAQATAPLLYSTQAVDPQIVIYFGFTPSTGNVGHGSPAMRISRTMRSESAFCDFIRSTSRS